MKRENRIPYKGLRFNREEMKQRSVKFLKDILKRRSIREFSDEEIPLQVIKNCLKSANSAPSGANMQPWHFVVVSNREIKKEIRRKAEIEEEEFYSNKAPEEWLEVLEPLGTDANKEFLETAPYLIIIFEKKFERLSDGSKKKHYYTKESVGIATGFLISALHHAGLVSLTHTPSPMNFLNELCKRPSNEKPYLILVTGFPAKNVKVPDISKKDLDSTATFFPDED